VVTEDYTFYYSYATVIGFSPRKSNPEQVKILCGGKHTVTTNKHLSWLRDRHSIVVPSVVFHNVLIPNIDARRPVHKARLERDVIVVSPRKEGEEPLVPELKTEAAYLEAIKKYNRSQGAKKAAQTRKAKKAKRDRYLAYPDMIEQYKDVMYE
jgi:hypothetical protein